MGILSSIASWKIYAAGGLVIAAAAGYAGSQVTAWQKDSKNNAMVATHAQAMQVYADRASAAEQAQRKEEGRRDTERQRIESDTRKSIQDAKDSARAAAGERDRMRANLTAFVDAQRRAAGADPAADTRRPSEPGTSASDLLEGLLQRHTDELGEVGRYADDLRARGASCERKYDSLIQK